MSPSNFLTQRRMARLLIICGTLGCAVGIALSTDLANNFFQNGLSPEHQVYGAVVTLLGVVMMTIGCYLAGYLRAINESGRFTLDFTKRKLS